MWIKVSDEVVSKATELRFGNPVTGLVVKDVGNGKVEVKNTGPACLLRISTTGGSCGSHYAETWAIGTAADVVLDLKEMRGAEKQQINFDLEGAEFSFEWFTTRNLAK